MRRAARLALVVVAVCLVGMAVVDLVFGVDVTLMRFPSSRGEQDEWRRLRDPRDDVAEIYGRPEPHGDVRVLLLDRSALVVPPEAPDRRLLFRERGGAGVWLARTAWWRTSVAALAAATLAFVLGLGVSIRTPSGTPRRAPCG